VKICDPAIGSGAFPMGLLNELLHCREVLSGEYYNRAEIKKSIIQNNIYGVDIEKGAVDITRLRFWLSIVVDERTPSPLPNLDYKIMQGNSLIENFMIANLNDVFSREGKEGFDIVIGNPPYIGEKGHKEIFQSVKADIHLGQYYLGKMDYFYFFFHLAFNILASNGIATFITTNYYLTASGARKLRADIKDRMNIRTLFNLGELRLFDNAPGQHNIISIFSKRKDICKCQIINVHKKGVINPPMFASIISHKDKNTTYTEISQKDLYDGKENYIRILNSSGDSPLSSLLHKIQSGNNTLGNIAEVNAGIMGGCDSITNHNIKYADADYIQSNDIRKDDGVFVLDCNYFRDRDSIHLIKNYQFYKEFYKNSDINRYCTNEETGKRLIFSSSDTPLDEQEIIKSTLSKCRTILTKIREINNEKKEYWYQLRRGTAHPHIFTNAKIVCPQRSKTNTFGYNECDWYASADVYYITNPNKEYHIKYLLGLLNSKLYYVWLYHKGKRKGEILELYQKPLSEIPIKKVSADVQNSIIKIVDKIITLKKCNPNHNTSSLEQKIDTIVYDIYELSDIEIEIIEKTVKKIL
ncbi:MAG: Eco57I restriction-modification methylase domain-containing protein, partial [Bacteroidaceae bacterium]|nr:Eco57I restriction-modification methylase domain-containing protein [Bacteroidaceae bacterium]